MFVLCRHCLDGINSRGEKLFSRPLDRFEILEEVDENEEGLVKCDWCEDYFEYSELCEAM